MIKWKAHAAMVILNILAKSIVPLACLIWSFFQFTVAAYAYIGLVTLFALYIRILDAGKPQPDPAEWNDFEIHVIRRYHVSIKWPNVARDISCNIGGTNFFSWVWVPWMLYHRFWVGPPVLVVFYYVTKAQAIWFDPHFHLREAIKQRCEGAEDELSTIYEIRSRLHR